MRRKECAGTPRQRRPDAVRVEAAGASLPCTYQEWMDQQCSKAFVRPAATSPRAGQPAGGAGAEHATRLTISMGATSGHCEALMHHMAAKLRNWTSDGDDRRPSSSAPPAMVAQAAGASHLPSHPSPATALEIRTPFLPLLSPRSASAPRLFPHRASLAQAASASSPPCPTRSATRTAAGRTGWCARAATSEPSPLPFASTAPPCSCRPRKTHPLGRGRFR